MTMPRSKYVKEGQEGVFHCFTRCVRRAYLCGFDKATGRDFSHRKTWIVDRLRFLAGIFAIEVCAFAVMDDHDHTVLYVRPKIVETWSDREVALRWLSLYPKKKAPTEMQILALTNCPDRIAELRKQLSSLSWFMARLNEHIARAANKEDGVKGRFWESRFKCTALVDSAATAAAMVYVDLNAIRAGIAATPEGSDFTSIQERIRIWQSENMIQTSASHDPSLEIPSGSIKDKKLLSHVAKDIPEGFPGELRQVSTSSNGWLCPIESGFERRGILPMTEAEYIDLVDKSGRILRMDKRGAIDPNLAPILLRIGANPQAWTDTVSHFGTRFRLAAGIISNLRRFAEQMGKKWFVGSSAARVAFITSST
jgi:REP element-mobilizing transposase RayT